MRLYLQHNWYIKEYSIDIYFLPNILSNDKLHPLFPHLNSALVLVEILKISGVIGERPHCNFALCMQFYVLVTEFTNL